MLRRAPSDRTIEVHSQNRGGLSFMVGGPASARASGSGSVPPRERQAFKRRHKQERSSDSRRSFSYAQRREGTSIDFGRSILHHNEASRRQTIKNIAKQVQLSRNRTLSSRSQITLEQQQQHTRHFDTEGQQVSEEEFSFNVELVRLLQEIQTKYEEKKVNYTLVERLIHFSDLQFIPYLKDTPQLPRDLVKQLLPLLNLTKRPQITLQAMGAISRLTTFCIEAVQAHIVELYPLMTKATGAKDKRVRACADLLLEQLGQRADQGFLDQILRDEVLLSEEVGRLFNSYLKTIKRFSSQIIREHNVANCLKQLFPFLALDPSQSSRSKTIERNAFLLFEYLSQAYLEQTVKAIGKLEPDALKLLKYKVYDNNQRINLIYLFTKAQSVHKQGSQNYLISTPSSVHKTPPPVSKYAFVDKIGQSQSPVPAASVSLLQTPTLAEQQFVSVAKALQETPMVTRQTGLSVIRESKITDSIEDEMFLLSQGLADSQLASLTPAKTDDQMPREVYARIFKDNQQIVRALMNQASDLEEVLKLNNEHNPKDYMPVLMSESEIDDRVRFQTIRLTQALALAQIRFASFWATHFDKVMIFVFESMDELKTLIRIQGVLLLEKIVLQMPGRCRTHLNEILAQLVQRSAGETKQVQLPCERVLSSICIDFPEHLLVFKILRNILASRSDPLTIKVILKELLRFVKQYHTQIREKQCQDLGEQFARLVAHPLAQIRKLTTFVIVDFHDSLSERKIAIIKSKLANNALRLIDTYRLRRSNDFKRGSLQLSQR